MGERALAFLQGSLETTKGSNNASTRILLARVTSTAFTRPKEWVEEDRGTLVAANRYIGGVEDHTLTIEGPANFQQIGWFLQTASKGSVAGSNIASTAYRYIFSPNTTATGDDLQAASFELGDDTQSFLVRYAEADEWSLSFDALAVGQAAPVTFSANYVAQSFGSNTRTSGLSSPTVNSIVATGARFYLGATTTGFGSLAQLTGSLRAFSMRSANALGRKVFVGDGTRLSNMGRGRRVTTWEATIEGDANGVTRFVEWSTDTQKRMRLQFFGDTITGSSPATAYQLWIDGRIDIETFDPIGEVDTNTVFRLTGRFVEDAANATANSDYTITLTNDQSSYT